MALGQSFCGDSTSLLWDNRLLPGQSGLRWQPGPSWEPLTLWVASPLKLSGPRSLEVSTAHWALHVISAFDLAPYGPSRDGHTSQGSRPP